MRGIELALTSIDHDEIGERLVLLGATREVATDDLVHRRKVIDAFDRLDLELSILGTIRAPVLKPNARCDGVRTLCVRDVEAHQRSRDLLQAELSLQLV